MLLLFDIQRVDVCLTTVAGVAGLDAVMLLIDLLAINRSVLNTEIPKPNILNKTAVFTAKRCKLNRAAFLS